MFLADVSATKRAKIVNDWDPNDGSYIITIMFLALIIILVLASMVYCLIKIMTDDGKDTNLSDKYAESVKSGPQHIGK